MGMESDSSPIRIEKDSEKSMPQELDFRSPVELG